MASRRCVLTWRKASLHPTAPKFRSRMADPKPMCALVRPDDARDLRVFLDWLGAQRAVAALSVPNDERFRVRDDVGCRVPERIWQRLYSPLSFVRARPYTIENQAALSTGIRARPPGWLSRLLSASPHPDDGLTHGCWHRHAAARHDRQRADTYAAFVDCAKSAAPTRLLSETEIDACFLEPYTS